MLKTPALRILLFFFTKFMLISVDLCWFLLILCWFILFLWWFMLISCWFLLISVDFCWYMLVLCWLMFILCWFMWTRLVFFESSERYVSLQCNTDNCLSHLYIEPCWFYVIPYRFILIYVRLSCFMSVYVDLCRAYFDLCRFMLIWFILVYVDI